LFRPRSILVLVVAGLTGAGLFRSRPMLVLLALRLAVWAVLAAGLSGTILVLVALGIAVRAVLIAGFPGSMLVLLALGIAVRAVWVAAGLSGSILVLVALGLAVRAVWVAAGLSGPILVLVARGFAVRAVRVAARLLRFGRGTMLILPAGGIWILQTGLYPLSNTIEYLDALAFIPQLCSQLEGYIEMLFQSIVCHGDRTADQGKYQAEYQRRSQF